MRYNYAVFEPEFLLKISRPRFWIYVFGPYLIGIAAAFQNTSELYGVGVILFGVYFLFPANLLIYGINDIFDYETDRFNPKKTAYEGIVSPERRLSLLKYIAAFNIPFLIAAVLYFPQTLLALFGFLFFSISYSAPPIRAKTKPFLDSVFNILFVFPAIFAYVLIAGMFPSILAVAAAAYWTMAMHAYSAIPDIESDRAANIRTIATWLGSDGTHIFCLACYGISAAIAYQFLGIFTLIFAAAYIVMIAVSYRLNRLNRLFEVYRFFPYLNTAVGFVLFWVIAYQKFV